MLDVGNLLLLLKKRRIADSAQFFNAREVQSFETCVGCGQFTAYVEKSDALQILPIFLIQQRHLLKGLRTFSGCGLVGCKVVSNEIRFK